MYFRTYTQPVPHASQSAQTLYYLYYINYSYYITLQWYFATCTVLNTTISHATYIYIFVRSAVYAV